MQGAIAAGHPLSAEAGARVLRNGGNCVDACIGAAFAAAVVEGPLTGPAGGGFLLAWVDGEATVLDCFFAAPSRPLGAMEETVVDFGDAGTQVFHVGEGSVAVPGLVAGLEEAHRRFGTVPWPELVEPALELAAAGSEKSDAQRTLHTILAAILLREEDGRRIYAGERIDTVAFVETLERVRDVRGAAVVELLPELAADILAYRVAAPNPIRTTVGGREVLTTPPPSRGGTIVAAALAGLAAATTLDGRARALRDGYAAAPIAVAGTTHISAIDAAGNAAALSSTLGSGSGLFRGGTQLNNMLGELDVIGVAPPVPGARLPSMMTPTLVLEDGRPRLALGSAGSVRLAGAIAQVADAVLRGTPVAEAIDRPRIHVDGDVLHLEGGLTEAVP
ncbi:MAG TPA: gamma-glutamyltransferase, partial [Gaiellaceae bacterium]|nr:gamma-glutamyltransferase [Gaiellaceae bacterium]